MPPPFLHMTSSRMSSLQLLLALIVWLPAARAWGQETAEPSREPPVMFLKPRTERPPVELPAQEIPDPRPAPVPATGSPMVTPPAEQTVMPINLAAALRLTQTNNLDIAQAQQVIAQARAGLERADTMIFPTISFGSTYVDHEGRIQQAVGNILNTNRNSLWVGGGPSVAFQFNDALFTALAARQVVRGSEALAQRVTNDTLGTVVEVYLTILRARRRVARVEATLEYLTEDKPNPRRGDAKGLLPLIRDFVKAGDPAALKADLARVEVEVLKRQEEGRLAFNELQLASVELARLLRLDGQVILWPVE